MRASLQYLIDYAVGLSLRLLHTLQGHVPVLLHFLALVIFHLLRSLHLLEIETGSFEELLAQSSSEMCMRLYTLFGMVYHALQYIYKGYITNPLFNQHSGKKKNGKFRVETN